MKATAKTSFPPIRYGDPSHSGTSFPPTGRGIFPPIHVHPNGRKWKLEDYGLKNLQL